MDAELQQGQVLPVALLRDRPAAGRLPGQRLVSVYGVSLVVIAAMMMMMMMMMVMMMILTFAGMMV